MMLSLLMMECRDQLLRMELLIKMKKDYCGLVTLKDWFMSIRNVWTKCVARFVRLYLPIYWLMAYLLPVPLWNTTRIIWLSVSQISPMVCHLPYYMNIDWREWTRTGNYWLRRTKSLITDFLLELILSVYAFREMSNRKLSVKWQYALWYLGGDGRFPFY